MTGLSVYAQFQKLNSVTFAGQGSTTQMNFLPSSSSISSDDILAYRPSYHDRHGSNLATLFINLGAVYPVLRLTITSLVNYSREKMMDFIEDEPSLKRVMEEIL